jgi:hypothetical protein
MVMAVLVLVISAGLFPFYLQATCEKILRQKFAHSYFESVVGATRLEFLCVRKRVEAEGIQNYAGLRLALKCDFLALKYLLKQSQDANLRPARQDQMLMTYFQVILLFLGLAHAFKLGEKAALLKLTAILQYFSNVIGERMDGNRLASVNASNYLGM